MPASIFLDFNLPNATTWFYLSSLLAVALFFKFNRWLSLRNWDLITLFMMVPGFLLLLEARNGTSHSPPAPDRMWIGYLWLLIGSWYFFVRCMIDLALTRRPSLNPNMNLAGLAWLTGTLFICLGGVAIRRPIEPEPQVGKGSAGLEEGQRRVADLVTQTAGEPQDGRGTRFWVESALAGACHLAVVIALILIGVWHFQDAIAGMAAATLYLLLPFINFHIGQIHHVWPTALLLWAIVAYRRPTVAGALVGAATGSLFFPIVTIPVWMSFYWGRGARRFAGAAVLTAGVSLFLTLILVWWAGHLPGALRQLFAQPDWLPWRVPQAESFWTGVHWAYRIPVFIVYLFFVIILGFWPSPKNLAQLIALVSAVLLGIQFWYADRGGVYALWYLPILLLMMFRPNLSDRRPPIPESDDDFVLRGARAAQALISRFTQRPQPVARS